LEKRDHIRAIAQQPEITAAWHNAHGRSCTEADIDAMYADSVTVQIECVADFADLIPGTLATIEDCRARGLKIGTTTGYSRAVMDVLLPTAAERGYMPDVVVCPTDVPAGRPTPWMIYHNAMQLGIYPMAAIVKVGDTVPDIEEGLNAGVWTVAVSQTGNELGLNAAEVAALTVAERDYRLTSIETRLRQAGAHFVVRSITDISVVLDDIQSRLHLGEQP
jgi:phosphonoacetaldehyde hydrolase